MEATPKARLQGSRNLLRSSSSQTHLHYLLPAATQASIPAPITSLDELLVFSTSDLLSLSLVITSYSSCEYIFHRVKVPHRRIHHRYPSTDRTLLLASHTCNSY